MKDTIFTKILSLLVILALLAAMALTFTACTEEDTPTTDTTEQTDIDNTDHSNFESEEALILGEGATQISVTVVFENGSKKSFMVNTDQENVGDALVEVDLISGEEGKYGWFITKVDGEYHKWEDDGKYWAFYIDGEYANTGVSETPITAGATYTFRAE